MPKPRSTSRTFEAVLERTGSSLHWTVIRIPFDAVKMWGKRGSIRVKGEINGFPISTSLYPVGDGTHMMTVNKKMQAGGKATPGMKAKFRLEPDSAPREIKPSEDLQRMLRQSKQLQKYFDALSPSTRREIARWVRDGKAAETRRRRAEQLAERLLAVMEGERELPPVLQLAFRYNPKAQTGWNLMTPAHRRRHLFGIFYYRNPESRARRVAKAVEEMVAYAEKRDSKDSRERRGFYD